MGFVNRTFEENEIKSYQIEKWEGTQEEGRVLTWFIYSKHLLFLNDEIMADLRDAVKTFKYEGWSNFPDRWQESEDVKLQIAF